MSLCVRRSPSYFALNKFVSWKNWFFDKCLSFEGQRSIQVPSAENVVLNPYMEAEQRERRRRMLEQIRTNLPPKQY